MAIVLPQVRARPYPRTAQWSVVAFNERRMKGRETPPPEAIDALLPQTQCRQCGYPGCRPYADAIAAGRAGINQCAPGGDETIQALARLLDIPVEPLDPAFGVTKPPLAAMIDETICIGCTLCIQAGR